MSAKLPTDKEKLQVNPEIQTHPEPETEKILCSHCLRTASNGIKCKGICVADSDY